MIDLFKILVLYLLFKPGYVRFLTIKLPLSLFNLLLRLGYLTQMPLNDLYSILAYLCIICDAGKSTRLETIILGTNIAQARGESPTADKLLILMTEYTCIGQCGRVYREMRHQAHVVQLAYLTFGFELHNLIVDSLLLSLHQGKPSSQLFPLIHSPALKLLVQHVFKPAVFRSNLLSDTQRRLGLLFCFTSGVDI